MQGLRRSGYMAAARFTNVCYLVQDSTRPTVLGIWPSPSWSPARAESGTLQIESGSALLNPPIWRSSAGVPAATFVSAQTTCTSMKMRTGQRAQAWARGEARSGGQGQRAGLPAQTWPHTHTAAPPRRPLVARYPHAIPQRATIAALKDGSAGPPRPCRHRP